MSAVELARAEREQFADLLEGLTPQQWESPTLCDGWRVRDIAAHIVSFDDMTAGQLMSVFLRGRLSVDRINALAVAAYAQRSTDEIAALVRSHVEPKGLAAGFGGRTALTDNMIHQQDIRRVIAAPRVIDPESLTTALNFALYSPLIRGAWRGRGTRLVATDLDWSHGKGAEVRGTGEALLMAMGGRPAALADLVGPGKETLAQRI